MRKTPRIMDLGTGTGIWAINVAEDCLSDAQIMAVDLNQIQPALHLTPGLGHMEHVEIDWTPRWDDDERPSNSSFTQWAELFLTGMDQFNRTARVVPEETRQMLEATGFIDIKHEIIPAFVCPWSPDRREREIARWFNLGLSHSLESLSLMPLVEKHGLGPDEVRELCARVKREICILRYHTYCNIHIWTARKPGPPQ
ncbi:Secondary metabolism regulator lae1 [[Neocosmospora] mangrovei]